MMFEVSFNESLKIFPVKYCHTKKAGLMLIHPGKGYCCGHIFINPDLFLVPLSKVSVMLSRSFGISVFSAIN
jgi:hypothetical protein